MGDSGADSREDRRFRDGIVLCPVDGGRLVRRSATEVVCASCAHSFSVAHGIVEFEAPGDVNLRMGGDPPIDWRQVLRTGIIQGRRLSGTRFEHVLFAWNTFYRKHANLIEEHAPPDRGGILADLGCGDALVLDHLQCAGGHYYGFDLSHDQLALAQAYHPQHFYGVASAVHVPLADGVCSAVLSSEVIEHLDNPLDHLRECHRVLRAGGVLILSTPCASKFLYPHNVWKILSAPHVWHGRVSAHRDWRTAIEGHPALRPRVLRRWIETAGFEVIGHDSALFFVETPVRLTMRTCEWLERFGEWAPRCFRRHVRALESLLALPPFRFLGTRQFIVARKGPVSDVERRRAHPLCLQCAGTAPGGNAL